MLRYAFPVAETSFDPAQISDLYSRIITPHIFEGLYKYDHLARPFKMRPLTADGMPEGSDDFRTWTVRIRPGIYFADDPAFKGSRRELVAQDYVYAFKRFADPANKSPIWSRHRDEGFVGLDELREEALTARSRSTTTARSRACARSTATRCSSSSRTRARASSRASPPATCSARWRARWSSSTATRPRRTRSAPGRSGWSQWRRSSLMVLERNPDFREMLYDAEPAADDAEGQALLARFKGRRLPMVDRVEVSIIEEDQPRWLAFLNGEIDFVAASATIHPAGHARRQARAQPGQAGHPRLARSIEPASHPLSTSTWKTRWSAATRRRRWRCAARSASASTSREIIALRRRPGDAGADPDRAAHHAATTRVQDREQRVRPGARQGAARHVRLRRRDGDGWRDQPDGRPLVLRVATQPDAARRQFDELLDRRT